MLGLMLGLWIGPLWVIILMTFFGGMVGHLYDNAHALPEPSPLDGLEDHGFSVPPSEPFTQEPFTQEPFTQEPFDAQVQEPEETGHPEYALLGLTPGASDAEVKRAYRRLAAEHHPDRVAHLGPGAVKQATRRFLEIQAAYESIQRLRRL